MNNREREHWGYIIINGNTAEMDWDSEIHDTVEQAIDSLCEGRYGLARTEAESDERDVNVWWAEYEIRPVLDTVIAVSDD